MRLLKFNRSARFLKLLLDRCRLILGHAFLDRLRRAFDQVLRFLQAKARDSANFLDDIDFLLTERRQNDGEFGLFFGCGRFTATSSRRGDCNGRCCGNAPAS